jgi:hypothetical protein
LFSNSNSYKPNGNGPNPDINMIMGSIQSYLHENQLFMQQMI